MEYGLIRAMQDDMILSPALPRLGIRISPNYVYLGDLQYISNDTFHVEQFIFLAPNALGHVTQLLLVQFEGYLENKPGEYRPAFQETIQMAGDEYLYNLNLINFQTYLGKFSGSDLAHAADYIRQRAYTLGGDMISQRFLRLVTNDKRNEFIIAYLESVDNPIPTGEEIRQDNDRFQALQKRAMSSFEIVR